MNVIYSRGFPYGAPLVMLRGGGTRNPDVRAYLKDERFVWNPARHAWEHYLGRPELEQVLVYLAELGCTVLAKADMDPGYRIAGFEATA